MLYQINTAAEINLVSRYEQALKQRRNETVRETPTSNAKIGFRREGVALWVLLQLFGGSRWF